MSHPNGSASLRSAVENGTYSVSSESIADAILKRVSVLKDTQSGGRMDRTEVLYTFLAEYADFMEEMEGRSARKAGITSFQRSASDRKLHNGAAGIHHAHGEY